MVLVWCFAGSKPRDLVVRDSGNPGSLALAQSSSQLNGSVSDPSGASVAGAKINLTDPATGLQRTTTSNACRALPVSGCASGQLPTGSCGKRLCAVSGVKRHIDCEDALHREHPVSGCGVDDIGHGRRPSATHQSHRRVARQHYREDQISQLPIADRNVVQLLSLQPGVAYLGNQINTDTDTRSGAVNGMRSDQSNVTLDGIGVNDQNNGYAFTSVLNVPPDSVRNSESPLPTPMPIPDIPAAHRWRWSRRVAPTTFTARLMSTTATPSSAPTIRS